MALPETNHEMDDNRVIHHELRHWLMAREMGFSVGEVSIERKDGKASGHATVFPRAKSRLDTAEAVDDYLSNRIRVLLAGVIVEIEWYKKTFGRALDKKEFDRIYNNRVIDRSGTSDKGKAEELLAILAGLRNEPTTKCNDLDNQIRALFVEIYQETQQLVSRFLGTLFALAKLVSNEPSQNDTKHVLTERLTELANIAAQNIASAAQTESPSCTTYS